jgi:thiol-disulfide isomerase/thioredoxin
MLSINLFTGCVNENNDEKSILTAADDFVHIIENSKQNTIDILANDVSEPEKVVSYDSIVTEPENGELTITENNQISYTPNEGFNGTDSFEYQAKTSDNSVDTAIVYISIYPEGGEDFEYESMDGTTKNIRDFLGSVVLIDFFGANCQPCQYQMQILDLIQEDYKDKDVVLVSINVWIALGETKSLTQQFIDEFKKQLDMDLDWEFGLDDRIGTLLSEYASVGVPQMYILDKNGNIYYSKAGITDYSVLAAKIDELLR